MENNFEKELVDVLQQDVEIPDIVRRSLDNTYDMIKRKRKNNNRVFIRRGVAAAVCSILLVGSLLSNDTVRAVIKPFFNFGDKGVERVVDEGMIQQNNSSATDQNIRVTLDNYFYDSNKLGMSFKLNFNDKKILKGDIRSFGLQYRIKNGNGEYIHESVSDDKPLKGKNDIISSISSKNPIMDLKNGEVECDLVLESSKGSIPKLENTKVEVERVVIFYKKGNESAKIINGSWNLAIDNSKQIKIKEVEYVAVNNNSKIKILSAKASPTSFNVSFALDVIPTNSKTLEIQEMKLIGENGEVYNCTVQNIEVSGSKIIVSTNFSVSSLESNNKYKLSLSKIGEFKESNFNTITPDAEIELIKK